MAETATCLRRSVSNPSEISHDFSQGDPYQGDPYRALGESISFGRYMSESLAWEKWSAFSNNRYLEEAEKYSKPGSVAKMKAYFEAHYGRIGARKQAALEQASNDPTRVEISAEEDALNSEVVSSSLTSKSETASAISSRPINQESAGKDITDVDLSSYGSADTKAVQTEVVNVVDSRVVGDVINCPVEVQMNECQDETATVTVSPTENGDEDDLAIDVQAHHCQDVNADVSVTEFPTANKVENEPDIETEAHPRQDSTTNVSAIETTPKNKVKDELSIDSVLTTQERKITVKKETEKETSNPLNDQKLQELSIKRSKKSSLSKLSSSLSRLSTPLRSKKESISTPGKSNVPKVSSSVARLTTPIRANKDGYGTPNTKKIAREPIAPASSQKRKKAVNTLHMSINVNPDINVVKKASPVSRKTVVEKVFTPLGKMIRNSFVPSSTQNKASVHSVSKHPSATPLSESRRSRVALEKAFARNTTLEQNLKSPSVGNVKSSIQSPITFSPFNFRTEERAAKRRELFQKRLEKEAENMQMLDKAKVKTTSVCRTPSQSSINPQANAVHCKKKILGDNIQEPLSRSQTPKCEGKPAASERAQDRFARPVQRNLASKPAIQNSKPFPTALPMKKKRTENASPNIL